MRRTAKVATVSLNPAVDLTVRADNFQANQVNRDKSMQFDADGKGVNVTSFLADYGQATAVTGFLGQDNASVFEQLFRQKQIEDHFIRLPCSIRTGIKIVDETNQQTTDIKSPDLFGGQHQLFFGGLVWSNFYIRGSIPYAAFAPCRFFVCSHPARSFM